MAGTSQRFFRAHLAAKQLLECLKSTHAGNPVRMLEVGGAHGIHARFFRRHGISVDLVDMAEGDERPVFVGDYLEYQVRSPYDVIWSSHVLEHVPNVGLFLKKMHADLSESGYVAITVPPLNEEKMGFNHLTLWNPGILLLNAAINGFDVASARVAKYGYNVSLIARKSTGKQNIKAVFPPEMVVSKRHFKGNIPDLNWSVKRKNLLEDQHFELKELDGKQVLHYFDPDRQIWFACR